MPEITEIEALREAVRAMGFVPVCTRTENGWQARACAAHWTDDLTAEAPTQALALPDLVSRLAAHVLNHPGSPPTSPRTLTSQEHAALIRQSHELRKRITEVSRQTEERIVQVEQARQSRDGHRAVEPPPSGTPRPAAGTPAPADTPAPGPAPGSGLEPAE